jgi:starvation-inducible DNA-binding protein
MADRGDLIAALDGLHRQSFSFYYRAHAFHWNVVGINFHQFHALFGEIASDVYGAVDGLAESIRRLDGNPPQQIGPIGLDGPVLVDAVQMCQSLVAENDAILARLGEALTLAGALNELGIQNLLADRQFSHQRFRWFLKATLS